MNQSGATAWPDPSVTSTDRIVLPPAKLHLHCQPKPDHQRRRAKVGWLRMAHNTR